MAEILAQRNVERVDRAVAFRRRDQRLAADLHFDHGRGEYFIGAAGMAALFHLHIEIGDIEEFWHLAKDAPRQQLKRSIRRLVGITDRLAPLDLVEQVRDPRIVLVDLDADAVELGEDVRAARLVGDQELSPVAHGVRGHVLVGRGVLHDGGSVNAGLGRERALADIGGVAVGRAVEHLVKRVRDVGDIFEIVR